MRLLTANLKPAFQSLSLCLGLLLSAAAAADGPFPRPAALDPDVNFWVWVYTRIDTNSGYIHDAYNLGVIYETLELSGQRRADEKSIKAAKTRYANMLKRLAAGGSDLNAEEQRVLALWGPNATARQLRSAATNLRFQRGQSDRFLDGLARSGEWKADIESVLAARKLPRQLAALPHVESSFNPNAYSSVGAAGIWQFTRSTGRRYLHIDYVRDDRMDTFVATRAAAQLLEHNYQLTGSWPLALTAYNHGAAGVRRAKRQLGTDDITRIVREYHGRSFGFASRNFYVSFLAAVEVSDNPGRYFGPYQSARPVQYTQVKLSHYLPADAFARAFNTDINLLKQHNRALLEPVWAGKKRIPQGYTLRIPQDSLAGPVDELLAAIPPQQRFAEQTPDLFHKVVPGDTVSEIAARYGHSSRDIVAMNGLDRRYRIRVGQVLRLPLEGTVIAAAPSPADQPPLEEAPVELVAETTVAADAASGTGATLALAPSPELLADPSDYTVSSDNSIEVQAAETLGHYAEWLGLRASELRRINNMRYGRPVVIGDRLKLDFSRIDEDEFERRRLAYQQELQQDFFVTWQIRNTRNHVIAPGESLWALTRSQYKVPMWLLRQYNPDLDPDRLKPGMVIIIPELGKA
jgi:peptidoglycan lytic transglycosylase D